jgi:hypothetical protein
MAAVAAANAMPGACGTRGRSDLRRHATIAGADCPNRAKTPVSPLDFRPFSLYLSNAPQSMIRPGGSRFFEGIMLKKARRADA